MKRQNSPLMTVNEMGRELGLAPSTIRDGIVQGTLPGTTVSGSGDRTRYIIPRRAFEIFVNTGLTPVMMAAGVGQADTIEQGIAIVRAAFTEI